MATKAEGVIVSTGVLSALLVKLKGPAPVVLIDASIAPTDM